MKFWRWTAKAARNTYLKTLALVLVVSLAGLPVRSSVHPADLAIFYLAAIVIAALRYGRGPSIVATACSVLAFNFIFAPPPLTFNFSSLEYPLTLVGLSTAGVALSAIAGQMRDQADAARRREDETAALYALSQELTIATQMTDIIQAASLHANRALRGDVELVLADTFEQAQLRPDYEIIQWVYQRGVPAGQGTPHFSTADAHYHPLKTLNATLGVMVLSPHENAPRQLEALRSLPAAFANLIALAVQRIDLADKARQMELLQEKERLQAAVLSSVSHDLRTPLASITGALSSMVSDRDRLDQASQEELLANAWNEARRLNRLVANLLDMSRLESGTIKTSFEYCDIQDLIGVALSNVENRNEKRRIAVDVGDGVPLVRLDFALFERVLVNVLDNALKYSPPDSPIELTVRRVGEVVSIQVADRGPGIPAADLDRVFQRFYRAGTSSAVEGTGLGLAICKGIVELHGGRSGAARRPEGGTIIHIELPAI